MDLGVLRTVRRSASASPSPALATRELHVLARAHRAVQVAHGTAQEARPDVEVMEAAVAAFHASHPWITVKTVGSVNDDKIIGAIRGGNAPQSFTADNTGAFCSAGDAGGGHARSAAPPRQAAANQRVPSSPASLAARSTCGGEGWQWAKGILATSETRGHPTPRSTRATFLARAAEAERQWAPVVAEAMNAVNTSQVLSGKALTAAPLNPEPLAGQQLQDRARQVGLLRPGRP